MSSATALYTREVLALATSLARWPMTEALTHHGNARAATCGSTIDLAFALSDRGAITSLGLLARACAIGQAAAAIFAESASGRTRQDISRAVHDIENWLAGGALPSWPGLSAIAPAREFPARHGAILLSWRAALVAFDQPG